MICPLTHELVELMPQMATWLGPFTENVAHLPGRRHERQVPPGHQPDRGQEKIGSGGAQG